ncbi:MULTISPECIES: cation-translocating P-type ATPase [Sorangium]|uniref:cation-translocating P-type ATPase n=1 Tax=Sorangium TaxID=39643 RepID=UPI000313AD57|nr:cation-transporting P-type ATPase [Sorangium cellulosum]
MELAALPVEGRIQALRSAPDGLTEAEAARRRLAHGDNELAPPRRSRPLRALLAQLTHTLALLLWLGAGLAFAAGAPELGFAIVAVVVLNGAFAFIQEHRAEQVVSSLMRRVAVRARVVRAGIEQRMPARELVPGDVVRLAAGEIVPADCILLGADSLSIDLSMLTGETVPVDRDAATIDSPGRAGELALPSLLPSGASVVTGAGEALVFATGAESAAGKIARLLEQGGREGSLLERQVAQLSHVTAAIAVIAGAATLVLAQAFHRVGPLGALTFAIGVIVALVPEGLLPTLSVSLAIGAQRMAARGAPVRRLSAVEVVGSVTTICTDKTGTLTQNALSVRGFIPARGAPPDAEQAARLAAALCNNARPAPAGGDYEGDPVDVALARWAAAGGVDLAEARARRPRIADTAFDARRRYMAVTCAEGGATRDFVKGAPEAVVALSGAPAPAGLDEAVVGAAERGERVLLLAVREAGGPLTCLGLACLHDPTRPEVPAAIAACRRAGVRVVILTGDHPATARAVAAAIGLDAADRMVEGPEIDAMDDRALLELLQAGASLARTTPEQKLRVVQVLRRSGEVVVATGDGVNDAPALRAADVGVAMGLRGTEVAKQAADIILSDDNFATIVAAIEEGRAIKQNIRRFVSYVFTSNVAELVPFLLYIFLPIPLPLAIVQVLAIDLGTDVLPALALGVEPASPATLHVPPEPPRKPILTRALALRTFFLYGAVEALLGVLAYFGFYWAHGWRPFDSLDPLRGLEREAATMTFVGIVAGQIGCLFAQRDGPLRKRLAFWSNPWVAAGLAIEVALTIALLYVPGLNRLFAMVPVGSAWLLWLLGGAAVMVLVDALRRATLARCPADSASGRSAAPGQREHLRHVRR